MAEACIVAVRRTSGTVENFPMDNLPKAMNVARQYSRDKTVARATVLVDGKPSYRYKQGALDPIRLH